MSDLLAAIVELNFAAGAAILLVLAVRRPARRTLGAHFAYGLWSIVPAAMLATLIPGQTREELVTDMPLPGLSAVSAGLGEAAAAVSPLTVVALVWGAGALALGAVLIQRQRQFQRAAELGLAGPAVMGFTRPRVVTPDDFAQRFSHDERKLILAHEQVHLDRSDARINALAALLRCLFWFNPLIHIGARAMRRDQELSCDAEVMERRPRVRRAYAETLLKTELALQPLPVGCYWPADSQHPLAERIDMLARKPVSALRRATATALVMVLAGGAGVAAWAAQPTRTVLREAPDVLLPFEPIQRDGDQHLSRKPRFLPETFRAPSLPPQWRGSAELTAELCLQPDGAVESVTLARSSGDGGLDARALASLKRARFEPAHRAGRAVHVCGQQVTIAFTEADRGVTAPAP